MVETRRNKAGNVENLCHNCHRWSMFGLKIRDFYFCPDCLESAACKMKMKKFDREWWKCVRRKLPVIFDM